MNVMAMNIYDTNMNKTMYFMIEAKFFFILQ